MKQRENGRHTNLPTELSFKKLVLKTAERYAPRDEVGIPCSRLLVVEQKSGFFGERGQLDSDFSMGDTFHHNVSNAVKKLLNFSRPR